MHLHSWLVVFAFLPFLGTGCQEKQAAAGDGGPPEVEVSVPITGMVTEYEVFTGRTQAFNAVDLRSRVTGYLDKAPFEQGQDVKKGAILFVIQQKPFEEALRQAKANRDQQKAQLAYAEATFQRNRSLVAKGGVSEEEFEQVRASRDGYRASLEAAEAAVAIAQQNLDWTVIRAPFDGRVSRRLVDPGNDVIGDNTILASVLELDKLYAYFDVDERTLLKIGALLPGGKVPADAASRFPVRLGLANEKPEDFSHDGKLEFADNKVESTTGTLRMWGTFANPQLDLKPGLFIRVRMGIGTPREAVFISEAAVGSLQGRHYVYVVNDEKKIVYMPVTPSQRKDGLIAVTGLKGNERVVVNGLQRVRPKVEVVATEIPMPRASQVVHPTLVTGANSASPNAGPNASEKR